MRACRARTSASAAARVCSSWSRTCATIARISAVPKPCSTGAIPISWSLCSESLLRYVIRTHQSVILEDASGQSVFSEDPYVIQRCPRSVLCLPLVKETKLMGVLYLEHNLAPHVFTAPLRHSSLMVIG